MKKVSLNQLASILLDIEIVPNMANICNIVQETKPKVTKSVRGSSPKIPFNGVIVKQSRLSVLVNTNYSSGVKNQLKRESKEVGDYKKGANTMPIIFGSKNQIIGTFNGKYVLQYRPYDNSHAKVTYTLDGVNIDKSKIPDVLPKVYNPSNQGTDKAIVWRKLYLSNLLQITIDGQTYQVVK